jgi:hypothetical protein
MSPSKPTGERQLAEAIRQACLYSAIEAYEEARMDGLCHEGAWEMALSALQRLDLEAVLQQHALTSESGRHQP